MSYLKASIDGPNGSGKSGTSARLAVGISKELCNGAPVLVADSEDRWRILKKVIFDVERVPLIVMPGHSLVSVQAALDRAKSEGCCCFVDDQLTTPWMEGVRAFSYENGLLSFERRQQLMNQWEPIIRGFRYGKFHAIFCGRLGYQWENIEDENGNLQLTQGDSKFNAGGGSNFGYEAELELEMRRRKRRIMGLFRGKTSMEYVCDVIKDATAGLLNGKQFTFTAGDGLYKPGDYRSVLEAIRPYLDFMAGIEDATPDPSSTKTVIVGGKTAWAKDQTERTGLLEELDANLSMAFPSGEGKSKLAKMFRDLTLENLNGFISWSRMEEESSTEQIGKDLLIVKAIRKRVEAGELPTDQASLYKLIELAGEDVFHPGKHISLFEAMGLATLAKLPPRKAQPVVKIAEMQRADEWAGD